MSAAAAALRPPLSSSLVGRTFVHPVFDYLVIGGGLSLVLLLLFPPWRQTLGATPAALVLILLNGAHFAASTVRLYTVPGSYQAWPFLTMVFPLVTLAALTGCIVYADSLGPQLQALYLSWSPYHYAAQTYGLAVMYCARSGCSLGGSDKRLLRVVCLLPFLFVIVTQRGVGLSWILPEAVRSAALYTSVQGTLAPVLLFLAVVSPFVLYGELWRTSGRPLPLISLLMIVVNGVWWLVLTPLNAFLFATYFHALQYLGIVLIFHVRERASQPGNTRGPVYHAVWFYGMSLLLAYGLFYCLPIAYASAGLGWGESFLLVIAMINIHHFIVDGFIWRFREKRNRDLAGAPATAAAPG